MKKAIIISIIAIICFALVFWLAIETNPDFAVRFGLASGPGKPDETANITPTEQENADAAEPKPETEPTIARTLDCESLRAACADSFINPSKVSVLGGEWAYTADPDKFVVLATVRYTDKDDEYEVAEIVMVGTFGGKTELFHHLNEHSLYTKENALQAFGAVDDQRFPLE